jgi:hypothetical protein
VSLKTLLDIPPWDWPEDTAEMLVRVLDDDHTEASERILAAELAAEYAVLGDSIAEGLLAIARRGDLADALRSTAVRALGPALEHADTCDFDDTDEALLSERVFHAIQQSLRELFAEAGVAQSVRRSVLESAVRAPQDWQRQAVRRAYAEDDEAWRLTAVFCMRFVAGFEEAICEALKSNNPNIRYQAVRAAGDWAVDAAWPQVTAIVAAGETDKPLLLAAIDAVAAIRPQEAPAILADLMDSGDEDIAEATLGALAMTDGLSEDDDEFLH